MGTGNRKVVAALAGGLVAGGVVGFVLGWGLQDGGAGREAPPPGDAAKVPGDPRVAASETSSVAGTARPDARPSRARAGDAPRAAAPAATTSSPAVAAPRTGDPGGSAAGGAGPTGESGRAVPPGKARLVKTSSVPPGGAAASGGGATSAPTAPPPRDAQGVVVDAATQQPIADARVLFAFVGGPKAGSWMGDTTDAEGRFRHRVTDERDLAGATVELRVSKDGYEAAAVAPTPGEMRIELRVRGAALLPGRVTGVVRTADGKPFAGEIEVDGYDDHGNNASQRTTSDATGAFVLEGVPAGKWRFAWGRGRETAVVVPDGGDVRVELRAAADGERSGLVVTDIDPSKVKLDDPVAAARLAALRDLLEATQTDERIDAAARERIARSVALEIQDLANSSRAALPRSDLVIAGLAPAGRAWVRLEVKPRQFWRVEVADRAARFPSVPLGAYTAVLVEPGRPDRTAEVVVPAADGAVTPEFR